jgi:adenylate cyclase
LAVAQEAQLAVLFADVCGSTQLYETLGDTRARAIVARCIAAMADITRRHGGTVIKTIGDEVMATFPTADAAAEAASAMQQGITGQMAVDGRPLAIRIGFHVGAALLEEADVFGDAVNLSSRVAAQAKAGQILTTGATVARFGEPARNASRQIDLAQLRGKQQQIAIFELVWKTEDATLMRAPWTAQQRATGRLAFMCGGSLLELGEGYPTLTIGRDEQNDLVLRSPIVSRLHARIEYRRGRFVLTDQSANGTYVVADDGTKAYVHRDDHVLAGAGTLGLGEAVTPGSEVLVRYQPCW